MSNLRRYPRKLVAALEWGLFQRGWIPGRAFTLPEFLGIGVQKAGTTWLYENLRRHPGLYLPERKEVHYFNRYFEERPLHWYAGLFAPGAGRIKGEITPAYSALPIGRIRAIRALMPDVRLLLLLRDPVDRAWSQAVMTLAQRPGIPVDAVADAAYLAFFQSRACRLRGDYSGMLARWVSVFPREQLFIGDFEDIARRPRALLAEVFAHLGVTHEVDWPHFPFAEKIHQGAGGSVPDRFRSFLVRQYRPEIEALYEMLGEPVAGWRSAWEAPVSGNT